MQNHESKWVRLFVALTLAVAMVAMCGCDSVASAAKAGDERQGALSDAQIVQVMLSAGEREMALGRLAQSRVTGPINAWADKLVSEHAAANVKLREMASHRDMALVASTLSAVIDHSKAVSADALDDLTGDGFAAAFMVTQLAMHQELLSVFNEELLPNIGDAQLRVEAMTLRTKIQSHLSEGQAIVALMHEEEG